MRSKALNEWTHFSVENWRASVDTVAKKTSTMSAGILFPLEIYYKIYRSNDYKNVYIPHIHNKLFGYIIWIHIKHVVRAFTAYSKMDCTSEQAHVSQNPFWYAEKWNISVCNKDFFFLCMYGQWYCCSFVQRLHKSNIIKLKASYMALSLNWETIEVLISIPFSTKRKQTMHTYRDLLRIWRKCEFYCIWEERKT